MQIHGALLLGSPHLVAGRTRRELVLAGAAVKDPRAYDAALAVRTVEVGAGVSEGALPVSAHSTPGTHLAGKRLG